MKFLLITLVIAQVSGLWALENVQPDPRALLDIWDMVSPIIAPIAQGIDGALATINNAQNALTNAVNGAIYGVTSWIGGRLPALGKRDASVDARFSLLNELQFFQAGFQQMALNILQQFLSVNSLNAGKLVAQIRQALTQFKDFLQANMNQINTLVSSLIPTLEDTTATQAISAVLNAVKVIEKVIQQIQSLISS